MEYVLQLYRYVFQAIGNFNERNETLSLRGERLDLRHCETMEEILRRVQFRTIDLEATHLDDEVRISQNYCSRAVLVISAGCVGSFRERLRCST